MKKKLVTMLGLTMMVALLTACGSSTEQTNDVAETTESTEVVEERGDLIEESDYAIFDNNVFTFQFDTRYFVTTEDEEYVTVSFFNEEIQTAGANVITFSVIENADAMEVAKTFATQYGVDENSVQESYFGATGVTAYAVNVYPSADDESENKTRSAAFAVANGDNVIAIEVLNHVEPDEGMDILINDKIAEVLDTFAVIE